MVAGAAVAAAAIAGRYGILAWQAFKARPIVPRMRKFYEGGFQAAMTRREAALILGVRSVFTSFFSLHLDLKNGIKIISPRLISARFSL